MGLVHGCECDGELERLRPTLVVDPEAAVLTGLPVAQDTSISFQVPNQRSVNLNDVSAVLSEDSDPAFEMILDLIDRVLPGQTEELVVNVRPLVVGTIKATLIVDSADPDARPNHVLVPITVSAINVGLPDIQVTPDAVEFATAGSQPSVAPTSAARPSASKTSASATWCWTRSCSLRTAIPLLASL